MSEQHFEATVRECEILRDRLIELDPKGNYSLLERRELGLSEFDLFAEQDALLVQTCEHFERWKGYLRGRYDVQVERSTRREQAAVASRRGLSRFVGDGETLDSIAAANASDPESFAELHAANFARRQAAIEEERARVRDRQARQS